MPTDEGEFVTRDVAVTLTDLEWASVAGLLGAVMRIHDLGIAVGQDSALKLVDAIEHIEHAHAVIQKTVMDAYVMDTIEAFTFRDDDDEK